jgi:serine/threonine-protein kinase HipA
VELALKAAGPLLADLEAGTAFAPTNDDGGSPFPDMVTRAWVKELRHRRRLLEG